jgi:FimV-like protein
MRFLLLSLMLATSLIADIRVSSPKISQQDSGTYSIEMLIEGSQRIQDTDFKLFEYKSNNPLTNEFITSIILEDLNSFQRLSINLADSYAVDYFAYRLNILNSFNKDIFVFLPDNPIKTARQAMLSKNFTIPPPKKRMPLDNANDRILTQNTEQKETIEDLQPQDLPDRELSSSVDMSSYITNSGDTMWSISSAVSDQFEADIYQIMWGIFLNNPSAFIDGDINKLMSDVAIEFPNKPLVENLDAQFAKASVRNFSKLEEQSFPRLTLSSPQDNLDMQLESQVNSSLEPVEDITKNSNSIKPTLSKEEMSPQAIIEANTTKIVLNEDLPKINNLQIDSSKNAESVMSSILLVLVSLVAGFLLALFFIKRKETGIQESVQPLSKISSLPEDLGIENNQEEQDLDLARTYIEMGTYKNAEEIITSVIKISKDPKILEDAQTLLNKIKS